MFSFGGIPPLFVQLPRGLTVLSSYLSRIFPVLIPYFLRPLRPNWIRTTALRAAIYRPCLVDLSAISPFLVYLREPIPGSHRNQRSRPHGFFEVKHSGTIFCERNAMKRIFCKAGDRPVGHKYNRAMGLRELAHRSTGERLDVGWATSRTAAFLVYITPH